MPPAVYVLGLTPGVVPGVLARYGLGSVVWRSAPSAGYPALGSIAVATGLTALGTVVVAALLPVSSPDHSGRYGTGRTRRAA